MVLALLVLRGAWGDAILVLVSTGLMLLTGLGGAAIAAESPRVGLGGSRRVRAMQVMAVVGAGLGILLWLLVLGWEVGCLWGLWPALA